MGSRKGKRKAGQAGAGSGAKAAVKSSPEVHEPSEESPLSAAAFSEEHAAEEHAEAPFQSEEIPVLKIHQDEEPVRLVGTDPGDEDVTAQAGEPNEYQAKTPRELIEGYAPIGEDLPPQKLETGVTVRVIGSAGGQKIPAAPSRTGSTRKGLEIGFRIGAQKHLPARDEAGNIRRPDEEEEEVLRLEVPVEEELPSRLEPLSVEETPTVSVAPAPRRPRQKKAMTVRRATIWMAIGTVVLVVLIVSLSPIIGRGNVPKTQLDDSRLVVEQIEPMDQSESADFLRNIDALNAEAERILRAFAAAKTAEEAIQYIRDPERLRPSFIRRWTLWPAPPFERNPIFQSMIVDTEGRSALGLKGMRGDYTRFVMLFVRIDGHLKLDWEASFGISDVDIADMPEKAGPEAQVVRVFVEKGNLYTSAFQESEYKAYQLFDPAHSQSIWGYVPRNSPASGKIAEELNEGSYVLETAKEFSATLRVARKEGALPNQFLILDLLQSGWVSP